MRFTVNLLTFAIAFHVYFTLQEVSAQMTQIIVQDMTIMMTKHWMEKFQKTSLQEIYLPVTNSAVRTKIVVRVQVLMMIYSTASSTSRWQVSQLRLASRASPEKVSFSHFFFREPPNKPVFFCPFLTQTKGIPVFKSPMDFSVQTLLEKFVFTCQQWLLRQVTIASISEMQWVQTITSTKNVFLFSLWTDTEITAIVPHASMLRCDNARLVYLKTSYQVCQNHINPCDRKLQQQYCDVATIFYKNGTCLICRYDNDGDEGCLKYRTTLVHTKDVTVTFHKNCGGAEYKWEGELDSAFHPGYCHFLQLHLKTYLFTFSLLTSSFPVVVFQLQLWIYLDLKNVTRSVQWIQGLSLSFCRLWWEFIMKSTILLKAHFCVSHKHHILITSLSYVWPLYIEQIIQCLRYCTNVVPLCVDTNSGQWEVFTSIYSQEQQLCILFYFQFWWWWWW